MRTEPTPPPVRDSYRHGDLRRALLEAGIELARGGGPEAVVLREATRVVGVVPNAAYRHFADRDELLASVCNAAMGELGDRMAADVARVPGGYGDPEAALLRLAAIGTAYLRFAREEPGLFATAFALPVRHAYAFADVEGFRHGAAGAESAQSADGPADRTPLGQLRTCLDELVTAGVLDARRRAGIEFPIWSTVHGTAVLAGQGPLRNLPEDGRGRLEELCLGFIADGLA